MTNIWTLKLTITTLEFQFWKQKKKISQPQTFNIMLYEILGCQTLGEFFLAVFYLIVGLTVSTLISTTKRDQSSTATPEKFSFTFLIADNWKRYVLNILLIYVTVRFYPDIFDGNKLTPWLAIGLGLAWDRVINLVKQKTELLNVDRSKINPT